MAVRTQSAGGESQRWFQDIGRRMMELFYGDKEQRGNEK